MKLEKKSILEDNPLILASSEFDELDLDILIEFLETGNPENVPDHIVAYMEILEKIWGMSRQMFNYPNNQAIINHLLITYKMKRPKAMQLVKDSLTYFHRENMLSNEVWRGVLGDNGMKSFVAAIKVAKNSRDFKDAFSILLELGKFLGWNVEKMNAEDENFIRQIQVVTSDVTKFGFEKTNRTDLAAMIDALPDISPKMKELAKQEVDMVPFKLIFSENNPRKEN